MPDAVFAYGGFVTKPIESTILRSTRFTVVQEMKRGKGGRRRSPQRRKTWCFCAGFVKR